MVRMARASSGLQCPLAFALRFLETKPRTSRRRTSSLLLRLHLFLLHLFRALLLRLVGWKTGDGRHLHFVCFREEVLCMMRRGGVHDEDESGENQHQFLHENDSGVKQQLHTHAGAGDESFVDAPRRAHFLPTGVSSVGQRALEVPRRIGR